MTLAQLLGWAFFIAVVPPLIVSFVREMGLLPFLALSVATLAVLGAFTWLLMAADSVTIL